MVAELSSERGAARLGINGARLVTIFGAGSVWWNERRLGGRKV